MCACAVLVERVSVDDRNDMKAIARTEKKLIHFRDVFNICLESKVIPCVRQSSCLWESRSFYIIT